VRFSSGFSSHLNFAGTTPGNNSSTDGSSGVYTGATGIGPTGAITRIKPDLDDSENESSSPSTGNPRGGGAVGGGGASASGTSGAAASPGDQIVGANTQEFLSSDETAQFESDKRLIYK
jgi:hypothetical protein